MSKKLVVLVGNIGSGKTTLAKKYVKRGYVCVSRDGLRYMIGAGEYIFDPLTEPRIFVMERLLLEHLMENSHNIVVDGVGTSTRLRSEYLFLAQMYKYSVIAHVLPKLSKNEAVARRMKNPHGSSDKATWDRIWKRFNKRYTDPTVREGFKKVIFE